MSRTLGVAIDLNWPVKHPQALVRGILDAARDRGWRCVLDPFLESLSYDGVILRAKRLLAVGDEPLKRVAFLSGLGTPQRLSQVFRRAEGATPLDFRRRQRPEA